MPPALAAEAANATQVEKCDTRCGRAERGVVNVWHGMSACPPSYQCVAWHVCLPICSHVTQVEKYEVERILAPQLAAYAIVGTTPAAAAARYMPACLPSIHHSMFSLPLPMPSSPPLSGGPHSGPAAAAAAAAAARCLLSIRSCSHLHTYSLAHLLTCPPTHLPISSLSGGVERFLDPELTARAIVGVERILDPVLTAYAILGVTAAAGDGEIKKR
ncbi:unnamed protein product [Closterium sp. Naga37s-1]|nr:unnamed protein product [Closterium sp. Naga37s-1]